MTRQRKYMRILLLATLFAIALHAEDAKPDPALAYQTARADAAEAALAAANRTIKDIQMQSNMNAAAANYCTFDWGDLKQLQAKADAAKKALDALKPAK